MVKIAILSDIHANKEALLAVMEDIKKRKVDQIYCLGDTIAKGIHPKECLAIVKEKCNTVLQGNCEEIYQRQETGKSEIDQKRMDWNKSMLGQEDLEYIKNLPFCHEFYLSGSLVRLFHASPTNIRKVIINENSIEEKYKMFLPSKNTISNQIADIVIYGHTHQPYMDTLYNRILINAGSVGNPLDSKRNDKKDGNVKQTTKAQYVILEGEWGKIKNFSEIGVQFVRVPYLLEKELEHQEKNIEKEDYFIEMTQAKYRDREKIDKNFQKIGIDYTKI